MSIETCEFCGNRQGNRNKHRHQHSCSKNPKSSKFLNRVIFLIQNLVELTKNDNSDVRTNDVMLEIITNDHLKFLKRVEYDQFFKTALIQILERREQRESFFDKAIKDGISKGYFDKFFNKGKKEIYKPVI